MDPSIAAAGSVRLKNVRNILLKNVVNACSSALVYWAVGHAFASGSCQENAIIGEPVGAAPLVMVIALCANSAAPDSSAERSI